jgi:hypothetical protein
MLLDTPVCSHISVGEKASGHDATERAKQTHALLPALVYVLLKSAVSLVLAAPATVDISYSSLKVPSLF